MSFSIQRIEEEYYIIPSSAADFEIIVAKKRIESKGIVDRLLDNDYPTLTKKSPNLTMRQPLLFEMRYWTVTELTVYLRDLLDNDDALQDLWVQGEISNLSRPSSGHIYLTLKDRESSLRCVIWRNIASRLSFQLREGQSVEVHGSLSIYEAAGQYQLYADAIRSIGEGALYQEFLRLKNRLEAEGLFDPARKRPIPIQPKKIGIVSSPTGAALRDILNTLQRRYPIVEVYLAPTPVQGVDAPPGIIAALDKLNQKVHPDVILLARGGGSIEDLWAFNDEAVARAIFSSQTPIISGIGHETDFTIADFVSDLRAPTPTAAAELATPNRQDLKSNLDVISNRIDQFLRNIVLGCQNNTFSIQRRLQLRSPILKLRSENQRLDEMDHRMNLLTRHSLEILRAELKTATASLESLNPVSVLKRGYSVVTKAIDGSPVSKTAQVEVGEMIVVRLQDGKLSSSINEIQINERHTK